MNRNTPLNEWEKIRTPRDVARYARTYGLGKAYNTHGDVWNAGDATMQIGLLHLILDELQKEAEPDPLIEHREWLRWWHPRICYLLEQHEKQRLRLVTMFGEDARLGRDVQVNVSLSWFSRAYRIDMESHHDEVDLIRQKISRMKSVKKPKHITNLDGIGKKTAEKLISNIQNKHKPKD